MSVAEATGGQQLFPLQQPPQGGLLLMSSSSGD